MVFFSKKKETLEGGNLPLGWVTRNKDFCGRVQNEYTYFLNNWIHTKDPEKKQIALKTFIIFLENIERLCMSKGECYAFWFKEILTAPGYIEKLKIELKKGE